MKIDVIPKVWQINDSEWWLAPTLEEAIEASMEMTGLSREETCDGIDENPLTEEEMADMPYLEADGTETTFLAVYKECLEKEDAVLPFAAEV